MLNNFTLIIPTHNRHKFLARLLDYYCNFDVNFNIVVIDSSENKFEGFPKIKEFKYEHHPNMPFIKKIHLILGKIETKFSALCADDDFMIPSGINKCCEFLHNNYDYVSAQGRTVRFENLDPILYKSDEINTKDISFEKCEDRIYYGIVENYTQTFYSEYKTKTLNNIFLHALNINYHLIEKYITITAHLYGKHKVVPYFYYAREENSISEGKHTVGIEQIVVYQKNKYHKDYNYFLENISYIMRDCGNNEASINKNFISEIINQYLLNFDRLIFSHKESNQTFTIIKITLMKYFLKVISLLRNTKKEERIQRKESKIFIDNVNKIEGYPFNNKIGKENLKEIGHYVKKHSVV